MDPAGAPVISHLLETLKLELSTSATLVEEVEVNVSFIPFFVFGFWSLLATKLRKYYVIFVYILQGKMGKTENKTGKKITQLK